MLASVDADLTKFFENYRHQRHIQQTLSDLTTRQETIVAAVDDLNAAIAALTQEVQAAVAAIGAQGLTTAEAEAAVSDINAQAADLQNALNPPPAQ
jgi:septal ring factor EnvC (AmiA/AmiB activator)